MMGFLKSHQCYFKLREKYQLFTDVKTFSPNVSSFQDKSLQLETSGSQILCAVLFSCFHHITKQSE